MICGNITPTNNLQLFLSVFRCSGICNLYGYRVEITGVGDPPSNRTDLGYCSQIAVFTRLADVTVSCMLLGMR